MSSSRGQFIQQQQVSAGCYHFLLVSQVMQPRMAPGTFKALTTMLRLVNNVVGGFSFVYLAKLFKVQGSSSTSLDQELVTA